MEEGDCCVSRCITVTLGCKCKQRVPQGNTTNIDLIWFGVLIVVTFLMTFMLYYMIIAGNSEQDFSWYLYKSINAWIPVYMIVFALTCIVYSYIWLLFVLALCHVILGYRPYIHWFHKICFFLTIAGAVGLLIAMDNLWDMGWMLQNISLMITSPFLHVSAVGLMTILTWFIAGGWFKLQTFVARIVWLVIFIAVMLFLYLIPLAITSPCICELQDLPSKPMLFAHRGANVLAPENTMMSFELATKYDSVVALESDVGVSYDGVPFILHDKKLSRTTNVKDVFPDQTDLCGCMFNMSQLKQLDAGSWFLKRDQYGSVSSLSEQDKKLIVNQTIPTLDEVLELVKSSKTKILFDLTLFDLGAPEVHPYYYTYADVVIETILRHNIDNQYIYWLYNGVINTTVSQNFTAIYGKQNNSELMKHTDIDVNIGFDRATLDEIRQFQDQNISVNVWTVNAEWLYSLYWCMGVPSVTTDYVHTFDTMQAPVWHLTPMKFYIMWIVTDALSLIIIVVIFIVHRKKKSHRSGGHEMVYMQKTQY